MPNRVLTGYAGAGRGDQGAPLPDRVDGFSRLAARFDGRSETDLPESGGRRGRFGADALRVGGRMFAVESHGQLVVKLPEDRARALILQGTGLPFTAGRSVPMSGWVAVPTQDPGLWERLAEEAFTYVRSLGPR